MTAISGGKISIDFKFCHFILIWEAFYEKKILEGKSINFRFFLLKN